MPFTPEEIRKWHEEKAERERKLTSAPAKTVKPYICIHCNRPFGANEGVVTGEIALCDICND